MISNFELILIKLKWKTCSSGGVLYRNCMYFQLSTTSNSYLVTQVWKYQTITTFYQLSIHVIVTENQNGEFNFKKFWKKSMACFGSHWIAKLQLKPVRDISSLIPNLRRPLIKNVAQTVYFHKKCEKIVDS